MKNGLYTSETHAVNICEIHFHVVFPVCSVKFNSVCKLQRSFLHFQKFVTCVLWIFMYVVKYISSLELPLFLLSYLGRSLKHRGSSFWEVLGTWQSKYSVVSQQEVPLWKKPQLVRGTLVWAMAFSLTSCLLADLQYQTKQIQGRRGLPRNISG